MKKDVYMNSCVDYPSGGTRGGWAKHNGLTHQACKEFLTAFDALGTRLVDHVYFTKDNVYLITQPYRCGQDSLDALSELCRRFKLYYLVDGNSKQAPNATFSIAIYRKDETLPYQKAAIRA